ncbi:TIR domain-containing protein [Scytonema hofmannii PCC 7110]|uniref:TIR domain-containing protein n=1 Tax=Scytonema hofmannii PCC 7110 TaxID=128403 RepID=A0A139X6D1_9CYAN|nr:TIR domain-containing protein [Scytonema hofmannii]KYC40225.1 TIR domain-containing protein [Scytonema hofmannii PCC 7110]
MQKVLILAANPEGTVRLRLDKELRDIAEGLRRAQERDRFTLEQQVAVRPRDIQRALLDHKPQIVHFSGHGAGEEGLVFEDEVGQPKLVSGDALAGLFRLFANKIECVVLNGCYSEVQAKAIAQHIKSVVGMSRKIGDKAAIEFAVGFYDALGAGYPFEFAYELGCSAIQMAGIKEHSTPVLLKKSEATEIGEQPIAVQPEPLSQSENQAINVFFSYAHEDEDLRNELAKHLKLLERQKVIKAWYDRDITAGGEWKSEIEKQLNSAQIILLLISADFLYSEFCWSVELERAMQRHEAGEARVIPIILREVDWHTAPFGKLQALPKNAQPVTGWSNRDQAFAEIARGITKVVKEELNKNI